MIVLAVDNNPADLKILCEAIRTNHPDAKIVSFVDPLMAFKYSFSNPVDVLYTDIQMKRLDGFKLEEMIRKNHPELSANFISDSTSYQMRAIQHFADSYTIKPVSAKKLAESSKENTQMNSMKII